MEEIKQLSKKKKYQYESCCWGCSRQMAFSAFTDWWCKVCNKKDTYHNGNTPSICINCLKPNRCKFCGDVLTKARGQNQYS